MIERLINSDNENSDSNIKKTKYYDVENSSTTFQKILNRYKHRNDRTPDNGKIDMLAMIEKAKFKAEKFENENEYMMKELRNDVKIGKELESLFGPRAKFHYYSYKNTKFQLKLNKNDFFTPNAMKNMKTKEKAKCAKINEYASHNKLLKHIITKPRLTRIIFKSSKNYFSPNKNKKKNKYKSLNRDFSKDEASFSPIIKKNNLDSNSNNEMLIIENDPSIQENKICLTQPRLNKNKNKIQKDNENGMKNKNLYKRYGLSSDKIKNTNLKIYNDMVIKENDKNAKSTQDYFSFNYKPSSNKNFFSNYNNTVNFFHATGVKYLHKLNSFKNYLVTNAKQCENHFKKNDYGCGYSKMQYRYLTKKYFNK